MSGGTDELKIKLGEFAGPLDLLLYLIKQEQADIFDIPMIQEVAFGATVPEAVDEVLEIADYVTRRPGGCGAVREVCDYIYKHGAFSGR